MLASIDEARFCIVSLPGAHSQPAEILQMVGTVLGLQCDGSANSRIVPQIRQALIEQQHQQRRVVVLMDEAQAQSPAALDELRLLSDMEGGSGPLVQVFLIGQELLARSIERPEMKQLRERIVANIHLSPISPQETASYVLHRLVQAGWIGVPEISTGALQSIHDLSGGIPRRINLVSGRLLLFGAIQEKQSLDVRDVDAIAERLREESLISTDDGDVCTRVGSPGGTDMRAGSGMSDISRLSARHAGVPSEPPKIAAAPRASGWPIALGLLMVALTMGLYHGPRLEEIQWRAQLQSWFGPPRDIETAKSAAEFMPAAGSEFGLFVPDTLPANPGSAPESESSEGAAGDDIENAQ